jgi:hypothetical protein
MVPFVLVASGIAGAQAASAYFRLPHGSDVRQGRRRSDCDNAESGATCWRVGAVQSALFCSACRALWVGGRSGSLFGPWRD